MRGRRVMRLDRQVNNDNSRAIVRSSYEPVRRSYVRRMREVSVACYATLEVHHKCTGEPCGTSLLADIFATSKR